MCDQVAHGGAVIEIERQRAELVKDVLPQIADHPFAHPAHAVAAEIADVTAEGEEHRKKQEQTNELSGVEWALVFREPGIRNSAELFFGCVRKFREPFG